MINWIFMFLLCLSLKSEAQSCFQYFSLVQKPAAAPLLTQPRIAMCQMEPTIGDFDYNVRRIVEFAIQAKAQGADIAVFPELVISGYSPKDLLERSDFIQENARALEILRKRLKSNSVPDTIILGSLMENPSSYGRRLINASVTLYKGDIQSVQAKTLLPNYDVFDDARYFEPARQTASWDSPHGKIKCVVCEDSWGLDRVQGRELYDIDPASKMQDANLVVSINGSPYEYQKHGHRKQVIKGFAKRSGSPVVYVNQVGGFDDILFDGGSFIVSSRGKVLAAMPPFKEGLMLVDLDLVSEKVSNRKYTEWDFKTSQWNSLSPAKRLSEIEILKQAIVMGIRSYFQKVGYYRATLGLSGGVDSSVVAALAAEALGPENVIGVSMPSKYSSESSRTDAKELADALGIHYVTAPIVDSVAAIENTLLKPFEILKNEKRLELTEEDTTEDNFQARLRGVILSGVANKYDALVLVTSNKSELSVGQTTTFGDMAGALSPIGDLFKLKVYELARHLNSQGKKIIPDNVFIKPASAELAPGQSDEAKFGRWTELDPILEMYIEKQMSEAEIVKATGSDPAYVRKTLQIVRSHEFKRKYATIILKLTAKAFSTGRRIPVSTYYRPVREEN